MSEEGDYSSEQDQDEVLSPAQASLVSINAQVVGAIANLLATSLFIISPDGHFSFVVQPASAAVGQHYASLLPTTLALWLYPSSNEGTTEVGSANESAGEVSEAEDYEEYLNPYW